MDQEPQTRRTIDVQETNERVVPAEDADHNRGVSKAAQIVWFIVGVITSLLLLRAVLALLGANLANQFASFIYALTEPLVAPFRGLLQIGEFQAGVSRLEIETLLAAAVYALIGWGIVKAIALAKK